MIPPKILSLLLCESVERISQGRKSIYGVIDQISCPRFPWQISYCAVFGRFGFGEGTYDFRYRIIGPGDAVVFSPTGSISVTLSDTEDTKDVVLVVNDLVLPVPGIYWVEAWSGDQKLNPSLAIPVNES